MARVLLARAPDGREIVVKQATIERASLGIAHEARVLRELERAGTRGVPRLVDEWDGGIAMERLALRSLGDQAPALRADTAMRVRERVARAAFARLEAVHAAGVVHGDMAPGNVLIADDGAEACLVDFGLARILADGDDESARRDGAFRGTLLYAAPEVARGELAGPAADRFALAASLLHVVTGTPLRGTGGGGGQDGADAAPAAVLVEAGSRPFDAAHPWHRAARALLPEALAEALFRCLAFDPRARPREASAAW